MKSKDWLPKRERILRGAEVDYSKAYWLDHKEVYQRDVKAPMDALLAELHDKFGESLLFRPYRDTRFSADNTPCRKTPCERVTR